MNESLNPKIEKPVFCIENAAELVCLIDRMLDSRDSVHRVIWIEGDNSAAKLSFASYIRHLFTKNSRNKALENLQLPDNFGIPNVHEISYRLDRTDYDCKPLRQFKKGDLEAVEISDNTIFFLSEPSAEAPMTINDDMELLQFISRLSGHNSWLVWISNRLSDQFNESEADKSAMKIRDHEALSVIRLWKPNRFDRHEYQ